MTTRRLQVQKQVRRQRSAPVEPAAQAAPEQNEASKAAAQTLRNIEKVLA